jgi:gamma-glutamyltranspeptidase/glutathione hydrolase
MDTTKCWRFCLVLLAVSLLVAPPLWAASDKETPGVPAKSLPDTAKGTPPSWAGKAFRQGVVTVNNPLAAEAGAQALEKGGNAIDAIAAIQFVMNVVEPEYSGIGGGGFMVIHLAKTNETFMLDCREKAPAAATFNQFQSPGSSAQTNGLAVGVPGTLMCVDTALKNWGTITLAEALQYAIPLAEQGFYISEPLASDIDGSLSRSNFWPETAAVFHPGGVDLKKGDLLQRPDLANTFRLIAQQGADVFYHGDGEIADKIVAAQQTHYKGNVANKGRMQKSDLEAYNVVRRDLVSVDYRGYTFASTSPPSSGGLTVGQMLEMLEQFPIGDTSQPDWGFGQKNTVHVMIEAMRLAFADRGKWMGDADPGFCQVPTAGLLDPAYAKDVRGAMIHTDSRMSTPSAGHPFPPYASRPQELLVAAAMAEEPKEGHTTSFAVVDKWGNMVAYTTTIEAGWGSGITVPEYGFLLNNELTDFNTTPQIGTDGVGCNDVAPLKRPRSSIAPSILFKDGVPFAAFGSPGGATIINTILHITLN